MSNGTTRFAPIADAPRRWAPTLAIILLVTLAWYVGITLP